MFGQNDTIPLKGNADSLVVIPVSTIREATIKLTERQYLKEICNQQDTIIVEQKQLIDTYIEHNNYLITENFKLTKENKTVQDINNKLNKNLERSRKVNYIFGGVAGAAILVTIVSFAINGK